MLRTFSSWLRTSFTIGWKSKQRPTRPSKTPGVPPRLEACLFSCLSYQKFENNFQFFRKFCPKIAR